MINDKKTSILIPSQLPSFVSEDVNYEKFVTFLKAYYEWMEQSGIVTTISIVNGGLGYTDPVVTINGDGTGATARASINSQGTIQEIVVTSYGSGYTQADVTITGTNLVPAQATVNIQNGVMNDTKNLLDYRDLDNTTEKFLDYFVNEFMPYFPADSLVSKDKAIKVARQLYRSKGTPASYELLFRMLYNSPFDYYNTGDLVLKASAGNWFVPKSLALLTTDDRFLNITNYRLFGETSKSFAVIENSILGEEKIEVFISDIERLFQSGEFVRVVDNNNQDVIVNGDILRAKIVGQISSIDVDPGFKGLLYKTGDPVIVYGGLSETVVNPVGASAVIGDTISGSIQRISLLSGGQGYNLTVPGLPTTDLTFSTKQSVGYVLPSASVVGIDQANGYTITGLNTDTIGYKYGITLSSNNFHFANGTSIKVNTTNTAASYIVGEVVYQGSDLNTASFFGTVNSYDMNTGLMKVSNVGPTSNSNVVLNIAVHGSNSALAFTANSSWTANINSRIEDVLSSESFTGYPLQSIFLLTTGGGLTEIPKMDASSEYATDNPASHGDLGSLGILGPIRIAVGGTGYEINDTIKFVGGTGYGAKAHVSNVDSNGAITEVTFDSANNQPTGGLGYSLSALPALTVQSANVEAANAIVYVDSIMGMGATFDLISSKIGQIVNINLLNSGEDYVSAPKISLRVQDIAVNGLTSSTIPQPFDTFYQGESANVASYSATVYNITQLGPTTVNPLDTIYRLRVFNYSSDPNPSLPLTSLNTGMTYNMMGQPYDSTWNSQGFINYGDGTAIGFAKFLNGLRIGKGQYLSSSGQLSSFDVIQSENFNAYTYKITTEKEISKYRSVLLNMLHPSGTKLLGRYSTTLKSMYEDQTQAAQNRANTLYYYTQAAASNVSMYADLNTIYNNVVEFNNLPQGTNIAEFIFANTTTLHLETNYGPNVISMVTNVDSTNNKVTIEDKTFLTFANTFFTEYQGNTNVVKATSPSGLYKFNDPYGYNFTQDNFFDLPVDNNLTLDKLVFPGDTIYVQDNQGKKVDSINYSTGEIFLTTDLTSNGTISNVAVSFSGSGYDYQTLQINITGDGEGANVRPVLDSNGRILSVTVTNPGHNYNYAIATISGGANFHESATLGNVTIGQVTSNSSMTVVRNFVSGGSLTTKNQVKIYGPAGQQYFPQITLENGDFLITEAGQFILLG